MDRLTKVLMQCMHQTCMAMTPREEKTLDYRRHHAPKFYEWSGHYPKRRLRSWCYIECIDQTAYDSYEEEEEYPYQEWLYVAGPGSLLMRKKTLLSYMPAHSVSRDALCQSRTVSNRANELPITAM